jgi:nucleotide-binding universal stress UspA family protein
MMNRIFVAVDDSGPALAAARFAMDLAVELGPDSGTGRRVELNFVTVAESGRDHDSILRHIASLAAAAGLSPSFTVIHDGDHPFEMLLDAAHEWGAEVIVMGRSDKRGPGGPFVGSQTEHLLEFTAIPVLVVPRSSTTAESTMSAM